MVAIVSMAVILLHPARMYFQPDKPVPVTLDTRSIGALVKGRPLRLLMLTPGGGQEAGVEVDPGTTDLDLAALFARKKPSGTDAGLWDGRTHYIQLMAGDTPVGSALVVIPLKDPKLPARPEPDSLRILVERRVVLHTDLGDITVKLNHETAPTTVMNFEHLVSGGFYTGVIFHRIVPGFVIQGGDPTGTGSGGPGYLIDLEASQKRHQRGTLSMARRASPDSGGSQFFICLTRERCATLDTKYAAFGDVSSGMDVVNRIAAVELVDERSGRPVNPPVIQSAELVPAPPRKIAETPSAGRSSPPPPAREGAVAAGRPQAG